MHRRSMQVDGLSRRARRDCYRHRCDLRFRIASDLTGMERRDSQAANAQRDGPGVQSSIPGRNHSGSGVRFIHLQDRDLDGGGVRDNRSPLPDFQLDQ